MHLKEITSLHNLDLMDTKVTDAGLVHLEGLTNLEKLTLWNTKATLVGMAKLQKSLPNCIIGAEYYKDYADLSKAIRLNPKDADAYFNRGGILSSQGEYDKAIADYDEVIRLNPKNADAYNNRGGTWGKKGEYDKAIEDFSEAIPVAGCPLVSTFNPCQSRVHALLGST